MIPTASCYLDDAPLDSARSQGRLQQANFLLTQFVNSTARHCPGAISTFLITVNSTLLYSVESVLTKAGPLQTNQLVLRWAI